MKITSQAATLVILGSEVAAHVASVAGEHVTLDTTRRRLLVPGDEGYPSATQIAAWCLATSAAAVMLAPDGSVVDVLDPGRATSGAWIEDAFVRALRSQNHDF